MAILLGRHQIFLDFDDQQQSEVILGPLNWNTHLCQYFHSLARELDIMEPKTPEGIYKAHLEQTRPFANNVNSDGNRLNLASSFVNGFVNSGFGVDKMLGETDSANRWFNKNREFGAFTAAASQGLLYRWDIDKGLGQCDRFLYVSDDYIRVCLFELFLLFNSSLLFQAGTLLAIGIISSGVQDPCDPASALLMDHVHSDKATMAIGSIFGLALGKQAFSFGPCFCLCEVDKVGNIQSI